MMYLHAIRIKFTSIRDTARILDFEQTSAQGLELIVNREKGFGDWLGSD